jgi:8-oxo-dGTP pyrophosphatase MutT (NUDIX family)
LTLATRALSAEAVPIGWETCCSSNRCLALSQVRPGARCAFRGDARHLARDWPLGHPKGNTSRNLSDHAAAEREATEEAGVIGAICPVPIGTYSYRKVLSSGASRMTEVAVFPLAVTGLMDEWKEAGQRTRQWFNLAQAATLVDEEELRDLLYAFSPKTSQNCHIPPPRVAPKLSSRKALQCFTGSRPCCRVRPTSSRSSKRTPSC